MRREYKFSISFKKILEVARKNNIQIKDVRDVERILKSVSESVEEKLDSVILHFAEKFIGEYQKQEIKVDEANDAVEEVAEQELETIAEATEVTEETEAGEVADEDNTQKNNQYKYQCPVCGRNSTTKKRLNNHLKAQSKKCWKHAEYLQTLN